MPGMLKGGKHTKNHSFIESPLVMNDISSVLGKRGLPFAEGAGHKAQRELLLLAFSHVHVQELVPGLWSKGVEMIEKVVEVGCASRNGPSCREEEEEGVVVEVGEWRLLATPDIIGSSGFSFELRTPECASINGRSNSKENSGSELADAHAITFATGTGSPSRIVVIISIHSISLPPRTVPPAKASANVDYNTCDGVNHCCQKIYPF